MPFLLAEILNFQGSTHHIGVGSFSHYLLGPAGMDEKMVAEMNEAMKAVAEDPTVKDGIASIGCIPGWHDLEESKEIHDKEYAQFVDIAKSLGVCEVE